MIIPSGPITRSTWLPHQTRISRLKPRWTSPEWASVALSGVSTAGTAGKGHRNAGQAKRDEAERIGRLFGLAEQRGDHPRRAVTAAMMLVAVRGKRCTPR